MQFRENQLFHIYNQGNNQRQIFFSDENHEYFLWKMRGYLLPFGDLIAWCLMPNHFHWLFRVNKLKIERRALRSHADNMEWKRRVKKYGVKAQPVERAWSKKAEGTKRINLNEAIAIIQRSYGRAINRERNWTGRLFRDECRAKDGWIDEFVTLKKNGKDDFRFGLGNDYGYQCFCYIHENPVAAGMVINAIDYPWSSARDYAGLRNGSLCNLKLGKELQKYI